MRQEKNQDKGTSNLTRREFIKGAAAGAVGMAAMGVLGACATEAVVGEASSQPSESSVAAPGATETPGTTPAPTGGIETRYDVDILIIGGGMAGLSAGIRAMELGWKNILIIDKASGEGMDWGGSSMVAGGSFLIPVSDSASDVEAYAQAVFEKGLEKGDMDLINTLAEGAYGARQWLMDQGCAYGEPYSVFPAYPAVRTSVGNMPEVLTVLRNNYENAGGAIVWRAKAVRLNYDSSGISGCLVKGPQDYFNIAAKRTILCTGGYAANKQFLEDHVGEAGGEIMCRSRASATGDGIYLAQAVGGYTVLSSGMRSVHLSAVDPVYKEQGQPGNDIPSMIAINSHGQRFMDEALGSVRHGQAVYQQDVQRDGLLFDSKVFADVEATMEKLWRTGVVTFETQTIEEMAPHLGVDPDVLVATVEEFNAAVNEELEITEGLAVNKSAKAKRIDTPPYYGIYPLVPGTSLTFGGLATSPRAEVMQADGVPVTNLYVAGEGTGGFFYDDYFGGTCMTRAVVFGHIAVESAIEGL